MFHSMHFSKKWRKVFHLQLLIECTKIADIGHHALGEPISDINNNHVFHWWTNLISFAKLFSLYIAFLKWNFLKPNMQSKKTKEIEVLVDCTKSRTSDGGKQISTKERIEITTGCKKILSIQNFESFKSIPNLLIGVCCN